MGLPANYVTASISYGVDNRPRQINVLWYDATGTSTAANDQATAQAIADAISGQFSADLSDLMTDETSLNGVHVSYHKSGNVFVATSLFADPLGVDPADTLPEYCAAVIQKRTATGGKSGRGRWYIGCIPETFADNSKLTTVAIPKLEALATDFKANIGVVGLTLHPQLYSQKNNSLLPITATSVNRFLGTERGRMVRSLI